MHTNILYPFESQISGVNERFDVLHVSALLVVGTGHAEAVLFTGVMLKKHIGSDCSLLCFRSTGLPLLTGGRNVTGLARISL